MKIGIFTDSHYSSQAVTCGMRYNSRSLEKIRLAYDHFRNQECGLVICLGDLIDHEGDHSKEIANLQAVARVIRDSGLPTVCVMGNHDGFTFDQEEFYRILGIPQQEMLTLDGITLLFLDACYFRNGVHYKAGDSGWDNTFFPHTDRLEQTLAGIRGDAYVFLHQNIDPTVEENHCLYNAAQVRRILEESGRVRAVLQGHYHPGKETDHNGIRYITFPAMCESDDCRFVADFSDGLRLER